MEQHLFPMIPHCLKQPGLLETQHILIIHFYLERNIRIQDYHMWAKLFLCTFLGVIYPSGCSSRAIYVKQQLDYITPFSQ